MHNKITPTPWEVFGEDKAFPGIESDQISIVVYGNEYDYELGIGIRGDDHDQALANAQAIVSAVNGTYGKGINPDAVKELYNALVDLIPLAESGYLLHSANDYSEEVLKEDRTLLMKARQAIEKAKLK